MTKCSKLNSNLFKTEWHQTVSYCEPGCSVNCNFCYFPEKVLIMAIKEVRVLESYKKRVELRVKTIIISVVWLVCIGLVMADKLQVPWRSSSLFFVIYFFTCLAIKLIKQTRGSS